MQDKINLKNFIAASIIALATIFGALAIAPAHTVHADVVDANDSDDSSVTTSGYQAGIDATKGSFGNNVDLPTTVTNIINGVLYVVGVLAVVMVIIGGIQYTTSGGDSAAVTKAKNTILYGIVGLVIAILAYAIVNFIITRI